MDFTYFKTVSVSDLKENQGVFFKVRDGLELAIFKIAGAVYVIDNRCPHMGMPLCEGMLVEEHFLVCRYHQWKFDLTTGISTFAPNISVKKFEHKVEDGYIYVRALKF